MTLDAVTASWQIWVGMGSAAAHAWQVLATELGLPLTLGGAVWGVLLGMAARLCDVGLLVCTVAATVSGAGMIALVGLLAGVWSI